MLLLQVIELDFLERLIFTFFFILMCCYSINRLRYSVMCISQLSKLYSSGCDLNITAVKQKLQFNA